MVIDPLYFLIVGPGMLLALWASWRVKSTFHKFSKVAIGRRLSGAEVAREMLRQAGISHVRVEPHQGFLSDHYDPSAKVVRLSPDVYEGRSISAVGVAAHECGHALQDAQDYGFMRVRQSLVGPANLGSTLSFIIIIAGAILHFAALIWIGIIAFSLVVLFQLVTLPVEFDASSRARKLLLAQGMVTGAEEKDVGRVLNAAALTYVAALITSVLTLLYFILRYTGVGRRD